MSVAWAGAVSVDFTEGPGLVVPSRSAPACPGGHEQVPQVCQRTFIVFSMSLIPSQLPRRCTFSLHTLFLPDYVDLENWIPQQKELASLGLYITRGWQADAKPLSIYKTLMENQRGLNVWSITRTGGVLMDTVHAYPAFSRQWTAEPIGKSMILYFDKPRVPHLHLHVMDLSDHDVIGPILSSVARYLPRIWRLKFVVRNRDIHLVRFSSS
jgi:hypothetical protein